MKVMRPSLLPGLLAAARRNAIAAPPRPPVRGRPALSRRRRAADARPAAGRRAARARLAVGQGAGLRRVRRQGRGAGLLEAAGAPVDNLQVFMDAGRADLASRPLGDGSGSGRRRSSPRSASFIRAIAKALDLDGPDRRRRDLPRRHPPRAAERPAREAYAPPALQAVTRDFAFLVRSSFSPARRASPRRS
jgi:phenylalanyl-tRNA synthetase beta chain